MVDFEPSTTTDELNSLEGQLLTSPKLLFSTGNLRNSWIFAPVSSYGGQISSILRNCPKYKINIRVKEKYEEKVT